MMMTLYLIALASGAAILLTTWLLGGGDADADADADVDAGAEADAEVDADAGADADAGHDGLQAWLPVASLRFWTAHLTVAGTTGALLTAAGVGPPWAVGAIAVGAGLAAGAGFVAAVRLLRRGAGSTVGAADLTGATGRVVLPVGPRRAGKVRLQLRGRTFDRIAEADGAASYARDEEVQVYEVGPDGHVRVTRL